MAYRGANSMANLGKNKQNTYPQLRPSDLKDPTLFSLNTSISFLYSQIEQIQNAEVTPATSSSSSISGGVSGQVLTSNGAGVATFQSLPSADVLNAVPSGNLTPLSTGYVDVPSLNVTLDRSGLWIIQAVIEMNFQAAAGGVLAQLVIGATPETRIFRFLSSADFAGVSSQSWVVTNTGSNVAKIQAKASVASGTRQVVAANTILIAEFKG